MQTSSSGGQLLTIKRLLIPLLAHPRAAHVIKYVVYISLTINLGFYFRNDLMAMQSALPADASLNDYLTQFSDTIDMIAWLGLVFLFELETHAIPDEKFTARLSWLLKTLRGVCYVMIAYAAYGFTVESLEYYDVTGVAGMTDACELAGEGVSLQLNVYEYAEITAENCASLSDDDAFYRVANEVSVIGESVLEHNRWMGWIDIDNAYFWIIVVLLIEVEVWLQSRDRFSSPVLRTVRQVKTFCYLVLISNMLIWAYYDYYLYAWDAFVWIFGFWAIELNLAEWEMDRVQELHAD